MKAAIKLYRNDGARNDRYPIKLILSHNRKTRRKTIAYSNELDWDENTNLPRASHPDYDNVYDKIVEYRKQAQREYFRELDNFDKAFNYLLKDQKKDPNFITFAEKRIQYMEEVGRTGNARAYQTALNELKSFREPVHFSDITPQFLENFKQFKKGQKLKNTTVRNYLVEIRAIYNNAVRTGITVDTKPFTGLFSDLKINRRRARNSYLEKEDILKLEQAEFTQRNYNKARDLVLLQFYLCGADFVDVCFLRKKQIQKGRVFLKRAKLGDRGYVFDVLLHEKAKAIIDKYRGDHPEYVFDFPRSETGYRTFRVKMYRILQKIKEKLEIELSPSDSTFTLKVMRHTFATHGKFARIEEDLLRELMGHERNDIDTVYKDKYPQAERDAAQRRIVE